MEMLTVRMPVRELSRQAVLCSPDGSAVDPNDATDTSNSVAHTLGLAYIWHREMMRRAHQWRPSPGATARGGPCPPADRSNALEPGPRQSGASSGL